jgi:hypothetical protein
MTVARGRVALLHKGFFVERVTGIEPALSAWEADVLPLNYTRGPARCYPRPPVSGPLGGLGVRLSREISIARKAIAQCVPHGDPLMEPSLEDRERPHRERGHPSHGRRHRGEAESVLG